MKTEELTGVWLDYWVAKALDLPLSDEWKQGKFVMIGTGYGDMERYSPSSDWAVGGPIIEAARIDISSADEFSSDQRWFAGMWRGPSTADMRTVSETRGDKPLVAAMRCLVMNKFGQNVPKPK